MILADAESAQARLELGEILTDLLASSAPRTEAVSRAERAAAGEYDDLLWARLAGEIGTVGLTVPEQLGGSGASFAELAVVLEACGRELCSVPQLGSWLALEAILRSEDAAMIDRWVPQLSSGQITGAFAGGAELTASQADSGWSVEGEIALLVDGVGADLLVAPVQTPDETRLAVVPLTGVERSQVESLDLTRQLARVELHGAEAALLGADKPEALIETLRDLAAVAVACEQLGVSEGALAEAVAYAGDRVQFGRPIGSFQAVKHLLADMATATDLARSLVEHAVWAACEDPGSLAEAAAMAQIQASRAACFVSAESVQVHGGIGFSWEHPAHLYFRKARSNAVILGDRAYFTDRLLAGLGVEAE